MTPKDRLIVALDVPAPDEARALVDSLQDAVGMFKVGSQLFTEAGAPFVRELVSRGLKVFLDLKYHDIPNTVANAVARAAELGVSLLTVHALGGRAMMEAARGAPGIVASAACRRPRSTLSSAAWRAYSSACSSANSVASAFSALTLYGGRTLSISSTRAAWPHR